MASSYDLVIIGGGPACGPAARRCREAGWSVAIIESGLLGGVCPHTGCNPKKALMGPAEAVSMARHLAGKGLTGEPHPDWPAMAAFTRTFTEPVAPWLAEHYRKADIDVLHARATFTGPRTLQAGNTSIAAKKILIAAGATHQRFDFPGAEYLHTSDDFLALEKLPPRIVFVGGGFVAFELAHLAHICGARATILTHGDTALRRFDTDAATRLVEATRAMGIAVHVNAPVTRIDQEPHGLCLSAPGFDIAADMTVNAAGRPPQIRNLGLDLANVAASPAGISVNEFLQSTTNPDVYAAGDCLDAPFALTPTADLESKVAAENMLHGNTTLINRTGTPSVLFTQPPLAMVGLTEADCLAKNIPFTKKEYDLADAFPWKRLGEHPGYSKTLVDPGTDHILGAHILGHAADELINTVALAMRQGLPAKALREAIWAYPTCGYYLRNMF
ncbi:dihydrolipoyl dehydrogenase family protein [Solidesulfovibrio sp.]